jgi:glycosyltransferase involved in cell wall biosynthesis
LGVEPVLLGPVEHDALPALVAQAAAFAFPSTKEGFGLAAMEALAARVPVVMRDLPVLHEVFGDAVTYAATVDELAAGLLDAAASTDSRLLDRGSRVAQCFDWQTAARAHQAFYQLAVPVG